jgi:chromosome segregation ATPase
MNADPSREFKFRIEDGPPERYLEADEEDRRFRKLNRRITWIAFLVPCLAGLLVAAGYIDLKGRLARIDHVGVQEIEALARDLDARLAAFTERQSALITEIGERISLLSKKTDALAVDLKNAEAAFDQSLVRTAKSVEKSAMDLAASKVDRRELDKAVGGVQKTLDPLEKRVNAVSSEIAALDNNFTRELASLAGTLDGLNRDLAVLKEEMTDFSGTDELASLSRRLDSLESEMPKLKSRISSAASGGIDQDYLDARLLKEQRIFQLKLDQRSGDIQSRLTELEKQLSALRAAASAAGPSS